MILIVLIGVKLKTNKNNTTKKYLTSLLLISFILFNALDIIITILIKHKFSAFNELNPIFLKTGSMFLMFGVKLIVIGLLVGLFFYYKKIPHEAYRYGLVLVILSLMFYLVPIVVSNFLIYNLQPFDIRVTTQLSTEKLNMIREEKQQERNTLNLDYNFILAFSSFLIFKRIEREHGFIKNNKKRNIN